MKKIDITSQISGIDPKFIEEAVNHKVKRISAVRVVAIAACLAILVTSVPLALIMSRRDETEPPKTTESETTKPNDQNVIPPEPLKVVYCDTEEVSLEDLWQNEFKDKEVKLQNFKLYDAGGINWHDGYELLKKSSDIPEKLTLNINGKVYTGVFDRVYFVSNNTNNTILKSYTQMARYKIEGLSNSPMDRYIYYRVATKTIVKMDYVCDNKAVGDFTIEEIYQKAIDDVRSLYGDSVLDKYAIEHCLKLLDRPHEEMFEVIFTRSVGEYKTDSEIRLIYNGKGELSHISTRNFGIFDFVEHLMNEKTLQEAEKEAHNLMGNKLVCEKKLVIHEDGYLCILFKLITGNKDNGTPITTKFYYRVE